MRLADIVLDIPSKALDKSYTYSIDSFTDVIVGCCVQVSFGNRAAVGFVMRIYDGAPPEKVKPISDILTEPFFNELGARCAMFLAQRYVAPLSSCVRLLVPRGSVPRTVKRSGGGWSIERPAVSKIDELWVSKGAQFDSFAPKSNAIKQRAIMETVSVGDIQQRELTLLYGNVSAALKSLAKAGAVDLTKKRLYRNASETLSHSSVFTPKSKPDELTASQTEALSVISQCIESAQGDVVLLDGVTGSGKTEVYLQAIQKCLEQGRGAIVLVSEISLTPQTLARFRGRLGNTVALLHSKMSNGERFDEWDRIRRGECRVVVGARSALFCPMDDIGIIIIDEEHESTYKQESAPRYVSRDVAEWMVKEVGATLVLGSATPSIEALYRAAKSPGWHHVVLPERANGKKLPEIEVIDMSLEFQANNRSIFSTKLKDAIKEELKASHKVVLLLNQRGFSKFLLCRDCGFVPECHRCSTTLTYHESGNKLVCHHCGLELPAPPVCPACKGPYLKKFGVGTQRVEAELYALLQAESSVDPEMVLPSDVSGNSFEGSSDTACDLADVKVIRMDADTTANKGSHLKLLEEFGSAERAILLGTQMIAKGLDFDEVTLVGVINADTQLHLPDFRASERTFDLIEQVAGRAGRAQLPGRVMVQTYEADNIAIQSASKYDRALFLKSELPKRKVLGFPPYVRMANILVWGKDLSVVQNHAKYLYQLMSEELARLEYAEWILLPAIPCVFEKIRNDHRWHIVLKCPLEDDLSSFLDGVFRRPSKETRVNVAVDVDPVDML